MSTGATETNDMELCKVLWNEYEPYLRKICEYKLLSHPSEIDDVIGETYLALCDAIDKGVKLENPKAWLYATLNNRIKLKYAELDKRRKSLIQLESVSHKLFYNINFDDLNLSDDTIEAIKDEIFNELLESERTLLILVFSKELRFKDIAQILDTTEPAVKQKYYRLKRKIKLIAKDKLKKF